MSQYKVYRYMSMDVCLKYDYYKNNGALAVIMYFSDEELQSATPFSDVYGVITVNLVNEPFVEDGCAYIDTNNIPNIDKWLVNNGIAEYVGTYGISGYCSYPKMKFNLDKIEKLVEE